MMLLCTQGLTVILFLFVQRNNALLVLLCFCINRSRYDDDDYINLCHKVLAFYLAIIFFFLKKKKIQAGIVLSIRIQQISWLPQVLLSFTVPSRLYILLVQGFLLADFALENINIYKAAKFLERQARKTQLELIFAVNIFILSHKGCKILLPGITGLLVGFIAYASEFSQPYDALYKDF